MRVPFSIVVLVAAAALAAAQDRPLTKLDNVKRQALAEYLAKPMTGKARYERDLKELPGWKRSAEQGRIDPQAADEVNYQRFLGTVERRVYTFRSAAAKKATVAALEARAGELRKLIADPPPLAPWLVIPQAQVGEVGVPWFLHWQGTSSDWLQAKVRQVIDEENVLLAWNFSDPSREHLFWVKLPTAGLVDGRVIEVKQCFEVTGTKTYRTAIGGSKTVLVLEPFDFQKAVDEFKSKKP